MKRLGLLNLLFILGCGVKGDPLPPEKPPEIGRGQPTYRRATEEFKMPTLPVRDEEDEEEDKHAEGDE